MAAPMLACFVFGTLLRILLFNSGLSSWFSNRVELTTPINSWKRVEEGLSLLRSNVSPYSGDMFHESPLLLKFFEYTLKAFPGGQHAIFVVADILIGYLLIRISKLFIAYTLEKQAREKLTYHEDSHKLLLQRNSLVWLQLYVAAVHFFNPYSIASCLAQTTTVFNNIAVLFTLYFTLKGSLVGSTLFLAISSYQSLYPIMLIVPLAIHLFKHSHPVSDLVSGAAIRSYSLTVTLTLTWIATLLYSTYTLTGSLDFLRSTYGFILTVPDLTPNVGIFWYFFTEMFEHFRLFFICVFQINAFIYTVPLAVKLRNHPLFFMYILISIMSIFKSYPSYGDTALYLSLLPLWSHIYSHMRNAFVVACMFLSCTIISPILWHLWINAGSANANFFFAITLVFSTAQVFLLTDILYAYLRRQFHLHHGPEPKLGDGRKAEVLLK